MDDRFSQLITDATSGLKDDPELRLDVAAELTSHLEETTQHFAEEGMSETDSAEQAMKTFGSPLEVAGELLAANKHRMRLRALARLVLRAVVVPVAVVVALCFAYSGLRQVEQVYTALVQTYRDFELQLPEVLVALTTMHIPGLQQPADRQQIAQSPLPDTSDPVKVQNLRDYALAHPDSPDARFNYGYSFISGY
ncbi:MAG TPA: permease prefix domain 1-containing protein, partial [Armatimonadota bacterium]|nr:permease prefix domain 1-containing protein [Armatimonadota bacterium]